MKRHRLRRQDLQLRQLRILRFQVSVIWSLFCIPRFAHEGNRYVWLLFKATLIMGPRVVWSNRGLSLEKMDMYPVR